MELVLLIENENNGNLEKWILLIIKNESKIIIDDIIFCAMLCILGIFIKYALLLNSIFNKTIEQIEIAAIGLGNPIKCNDWFSSEWLILNRANLIAPIRTGNEEIIAK